MIENSILESCCSRLIDVHILTLQRENPQWADEMRADLDVQPVCQHWLPGIDGDLAAARVRGFSLGSAPFVSYVDPDDRVLPGTFEALMHALQSNPTAPFAWAGERVVDENLKELPMRPHVWPDGYHPVSHVSRLHVHGVKLYRRDRVMPFLGSMQDAGFSCEFFLDLSIIRPFVGPPRSTWPIHVPIVGSLWRWHERNTHRQVQPEDFARVAQMFGFDSMRALQQSTINHCSEDVTR